MRVYFFLLKLLKRRIKINREKWYKGCSIQRWIYFYPFPWKCLCFIYCFINSRILRMVLSMFVGLWHWNNIRVNWNLVLIVEKTFRDKISLTYPHVWRWPIICISNKLLILSLIALHRSSWLNQQIEINCIV